MLIVFGSIFSNILSSILQATFFKKYFLLTLMNKLKNIILKYIYLICLLSSAILLSFYILVCTPLLFNKKLGLILTAVIAQILWSIFSKMFRITFEIEIDQRELDKIKLNENVILISNHLGAIDFMVINELSQQKNMLRHSKYMIKESIKYIPILGYIKYLGFIMMKRNYEKDVNEIKKWLGYFKNHNTPMWLIIYPEGTRFTNEKKATSQKFCEERGLKQLENILYPRSKGFTLSCNELKGYVEHIIDLTVYFENKKNAAVPSLFDFLFKMPKGKIKARVDVFKVDEIVNYEEFLKQRFYIKDMLIDEWKKNN